MQAGSPLLTLYLQHHCVHHPDSSVPGDDQGRRTVRGSFDRSGGYSRKAIGTPKYFHSYAATGCAEEARAIVSAA